MNLHQTANWIYKHLPAISFALAGAIYVLTIAPTFLHTDSGELAAVQYTAGTAHPTGYPLFTLLGWLFTRIPIAEHPVFQLNILCLLFTAGGIFAFGKAMQEFVRKFRTRKSAEGDDPNLIWGNFFAVLCATLFLAFSRTYWQQSTSVEVYSLHILLYCSTFYFLVKAWFSPKDALKPWLWVAFSLGLGFTNHMTSLLLIPGIIWLFFAHKGLKPLPWKPAIAMLGVFFGVLVVMYGFLFIRAGMDPQFNWGNPSTWDAFVHHVSGKQFQVWMFQGAEAASQNFKAFFTGSEITGMPGLMGEFMYIPIFFALAGLYYLWNLQRKFFVFVVITLVFTVGYVINYSIKDLDPYYLSFYITLAFCGGMGVRFVWLKLDGNTLKWGITAVAIVGIGLEVGVNYGRVDESETWLYEDYSKAALASLPQDAVLITHQWDFLVAPAWYLQAVENYRADIDIVEYAMLRSRHWYPARLKRNAPGLYQALQPNIDRFADEVARFDLGKPHDVQVLSSTFNQLWADLLLQSANRRVFIGPEMLYQTMKKDGLGVPPNLEIIPATYFYEVRAKSPQFVETVQDLAKIRFPEQENYFTETIRHQVSLVAVDRALYEMTFQKTQKAKSWVERARKINPGVRIPPQLQGLLK